MNELVASEEPQYSPQSGTDESVKASSTSVLSTHVLPTHVVSIPNASADGASLANDKTIAITALEKSVYVLLFALLIAVRIPKILDGRLWAEEGTVFFRHAWQFPWEKALWLSYGGYLNISANLAGILARYLVPLEKACYVTSIFGLIVQTFPVILLCSSNQKWLQDRKTLISAILLIATMPLSQEIWLSCIGSQCHLNLCVALILVLTPQSGPSGWFQKFVLLLGPLSGPGSALLVPLFALRAWLDRSKPRLIQTLILGISAVIQFAFFWHPAERASLTSTSTEVLGIDPLLLLNVFFVKHILGPLLGIIETTEITDGWANAYAKGLMVSPQTAVLAAVIIALSAYGVWRSKNVEPKWFFLSGVTLWVISNFGALGTRTALLNPTLCERYVFAPQILFELAILYVASVSRGWKRTLSWSIIVWLLVIGIHEYFWTPAFYGEGPSWRQEVHKWRQDPGHLLNIWPSGWTVQLDRK
jgi:hypothetical protein